MVLAIVVTVACADQPAALTPAAVFDRTAQLIGEVVRDAARHPGPAGGVVLGVTLLVELVFALVAVLVMPWGAADERRRDSFRNALRQVWLHTTHLPLAQMVLAATIVTFVQIEVAWKAEHPGPEYPPYPTYPTLSLSDPGYKAAMVAYDTAVQSWQAEVQTNQSGYVAYRRTQPWYVRQPGPVMIHVGFACALWVLLSLLRAVGAPREVPPIARPPTCQHCGYNLTAMPMEGRCPECGDAVASSLGPSNRPGTRWQRERRGGLLSAWWQTACEATSNPKALGRSMTVLDSTRGHRAYCLLLLPVVYVSGAAAGILSVWVTEHGPGSPGDSLVMVTVASMFGTLCVIGAIAFTLASSLLIGLAFSHSEKRNLIGAALRVACYLAPFLILWEWFGAATGIAVAYLGSIGWFRTMRDLTGLHPDMAAMLMWVVPNALWAVYYLVLLARGTAGARFANA